jgi:uncharacterized protein (DUF885 family)
MRRHGIFRYIVGVTFHSRMCHTRGALGACAGMAVALVLVVSCAAPQPPALVRSPADDRVRSLADSYLAGYFERNPDQVTYFGVPGRRHDRLPDISLDALKTWQAKEDVWLAEAKAIDPAAIEAPPLRSTHAIVRETLEGATAARVCRGELWGVSQTNGWQVQFGYLVTIQPVGSDEMRTQALTRWGALPAYLDTEIANLREGLRLGYSAPQHIVRIVIDQVSTLISSPAADSPFTSPARRDTAPEFAGAFERLVEERIEPAFLRYRDFLQKEYLPAARVEIPIAANPHGADCYAASVRSHSSLAVAPQEVHDLGVRQMGGLMAEMKAIAERSFSTSDIQTLLKTLRTDRRYMFKDREELIAYSEAALARAKAAAPAWFGLLPKAGVRIEPYPKFREKDAPNEYNAPAEDGSRPGQFLISAYQAERKSKSGPESTAFHETIPGHHLQIAIALERSEIHPIGRYLANSGYVEGWALYAERLADEMKLYSSDLDRLGMLSSQAFRAARLVVDSGLHVLGWTRQRAIDYMLAHTTEEPADVAAEIDRYIIWPGQATSYMLGMLEIRRLRDEAQQTLGARFDVKAFHDRVLEDGGVPLTYLGQKIRAWIGAS